MQFYNTFGYQWLEGSIRKDLDRGGRGDWADILSLASISRRAGYLERSPGIPYTIEEMAFLIEEMPQKMFDRVIGRYF